MKKIIASLLCGVLTCSALVGCGSKPNNDASSKEVQQSEVQQSEVQQSEVQQSEVQQSEERVYEEKVSFSMTNRSSLRSNMGEYKDDEVFKYVSDLFNFEAEIWDCPNAVAAEKQNMWITTGTGPDSLFWSKFNLDMYYEYVDQGYLEPLPDGWETRWPNIAKMVDQSGISELLKVDGTTYAIPHAIFGSFFEIDTMVMNRCLIFRKDWAKQVGMEDLGKDNKMTLSELKEYLEKTQAAGLATRGLSGSDASYVLYSMSTAMGMQDASFVETEDGFVFNLAEEEYTDYISLLQEWYNEGLLDREFYNNNVSKDDLFNAGGCPALFCGAGANTIIQGRTKFKEQNPDSDPIEVIGVATVIADDGISYENERFNYWGAQVFKPGTDAETLERILDFIDWGTTKEAGIIINCGLQGEHWEYGSDGDAVILKEYVPVSKDCLKVTGYCEDDFSVSGLAAGVDQQTAADAIGVNKVQQAGVIFPISINYETFDSDAKANFSIPSSDKIMEIVVENKDVESTWAAFLEEYKNIWEPLLNELNSTYYGK